MLWCAPHWDDLMLSVPARLLGGGLGDAVVLVVFSDEDEALEALCKNAFARCGVRWRALGFPEARRRGVPLRDTLRLSGAIDPDPALVAAVADAVAAAAREAGADRPLATCASPAHLDHAAVRAATERVAAAEGRRLFYYADQPYTLLGQPHTAAARRPAVPPPDAAAPDVRVPGGLDDLLDAFVPFVGRRTVVRLSAHFRTSPDAETLTAENPSLERAGP